MNKKGLTAIIVIIVILVGAYLIWGKGSSSSMSTGSVSSSTPSNVPAGVTANDYAPVTSSTADTTVLSRLQNVSVSAAETGSRVALVNGKASFSEGDVKGTITLGNIAVATALNGSSYVVGTLSVNAGGSSADVYAVLFSDKGNGAPLSDDSYALIGSGATVTGLRADVLNGATAVTVNYTLPTSGSRTLTKILVVENGQFNSAKEIDL